MIRILLKKVVKEYKMKKIVKILTILLVVGLLFFVGVEVNDNDEASRSHQVFSGVKEVNADDPCIPPPPPYPNNCH